MESEVAVNLKRNIELDEILEMLDRSTKRLQKLLDESKEISAKRAAAYQMVLQSPQATSEQKIKTFIAKNFELDRIERLSSELSLLYALQIFAFKVKVLEVTLGNIKEQTMNSGLLQKSNDIEDIKKNIDALKILVEAQYESMKEVREDQNKTLNYIH